MTNSTTPKRRVSDVVPAFNQLEGDKMDVRDLEGVEFVITAIQERAGQNGEYLAVQIEVGGKPAFFFTAHQAIYPKLVACMDELPLLAVIIKSTGATSGRAYFDIG